MIIPVKVLNIAGLVGEDVIVTVEVLDQSIDFVVAAYKRVVIQALRDALASGALYALDFYPQP